MRSIVGPAGLMPAVLAARVVVALAAGLAWRRPALARGVAFGGAAAVSAVSGLAAVQVLAAGGAVEGTLVVHAASGFSLSFVLDPLAAWFLLVLALLAIPIAIYSLGYARHGRLDRRSAFLGAGFNVLLGAVELVFVAGDVLTFLFAWELTTLATAALVTTEHEELKNRRAALLYLVMSHIGTGALIAGFFVMAASAGSPAFPVMFASGGAGMPRDLIFALMFFGFGVKAGIIPLHIWLPEAHPSAPSNISALMSGALIKTGIYGIVRVCLFGLGTPRLSWGILILALGAASAVLGVLYALMQHDFKRLLAYHSIENIGIILLGLGSGAIALATGRSELAAIGIAAGLYHVLNHAMFKGLLFLGAGGLLTSTGTRQIEEYGGLLRRMPWTGVCFLIGAAAIAGLPPLNGFASEWLTFQGFLYGFVASSAPLVRFLFTVGAAMLALTSALAAACFVKAFGIAFLALPRSEHAAEAVESPAAMIVPQVGLAMLCIGLGLWPGLVLGVLKPVLASLPGVGAPLLAAGPVALTSVRPEFDHVIPLALAIVAGGIVVALALASHRAWRRVPTWGCGGELTTRTEYTATAFSKPVMMIFRAVYRPAREVEALADVSPYFPTEVRYRARIEPTFERYVYAPLVRAVLRVADGMKVLQAGSLHVYLAYVIVLVVSLVLLVWWRG